MANYLSLLDFRALEIIVSYILSEFWLFQAEGEKLVPVTPLWPETEVLW